MRHCIVLVLLIVALAADAKVYTWTDANGVVHYTDRAIGPDDAQLVKGVEAAPKPVIPEEPLKISAAELQGTWCEFEVSSERGSNDAVSKRVEWVFRGSTLTYRDVAAGRAVEGQYRVEGQQIVSDKAAMGNRTVRKFDDDGMEQSDLNAYYRLRRGHC